MTVSVEFEPADLLSIEDPYPVFAELREAGPIVRTPSGFWCTTTHAAALEVLRHPMATSGPIALRYLEALPPGAARDEMSHRINFLDPPDHPRVRGLVSKAFTPKRVGDLRPFVAATAERLLDSLDDRARLVADAGGDPAPVDLLHEFAHQVPSLVISEMLGVPAADRDTLTGYSDAVTPLLGVQLTTDERDGALAAAEAFAAYVEVLLEERRGAPGDDLLSAMIAAEEDGERLHHVELLSLVMTLYSAGHRTTRDLFTNGVSVLLRSPDHWSWVRDDPVRVAPTVTEILRYETPTLFVARVPSDSFDVAGTTVGPFEPVLILLGAANRDPAAFADPERFDPTRFVGGGDGGSTAPTATPLSFAFGPHFCLGASLARMEAEVMLDAIVARWPSLVLAPDTELRFRHRGPFRGLVDLPIVPGRR